MPSLFQTFLLIALISFVLAAPFPEQIQKRSFKVERVPNPHFKRAAGHKRAPGAGTRALLKTYRKYRMPVPEALAAITANAGNTATVSKDGSSTNSGANALVSEIESALAGLLGDGGNSNANGDGSGSGGGKGGHHGHKTQTPTAASPTPTASPSNGSASASSSSSGVGVVVNNPTSGDTEYLSPVTIGGQTLVMDFDSGSSDLWVFNTQLSAAEQQGHTIFDPTQSNTFQQLNGATFSISYGDGSGAAGNVGTDTVDIGGATVTSQAVELATDVSQSFVQDTASNGLVGLAFSKLNTVQPQQQKTFFDNAAATLPEPVFTADLRHAAAGSYEFGAIDSTKFTGNLNWADVNTTSGFWQFSSQSFSVSTGGTTNVAGGQAIADTGTTLMLVDPNVVNAYYSQVQGAVNDNSVGGITFPCSSTLPDLAVDIGGTFMATVRGDDINFAPVDQTGTTCFGGLQATTSSPQIYGDIFFKSNFVAFNIGNNSLGVAPHQS
jgi:hypothetical protein